MRNTSGEPLERFYRDCVCEQTRCPRGQISIDPGRGRLSRTHRTRTNRKTKTMITRYGCWGRVNNTCLERNNNDDENDNNYSNNYVHGSRVSVT